MDIQGPTPVTPPELGAFTRSAGGLLVPSHEVAVLPTQPLVVAQGPITEAINAATVGAAAQAGHAELVHQGGEEYANTVMAGAGALIAVVGAQEQHDEVVRPFLTQWPAPE